MSYEKYPRGDFYGRRDTQDEGHSFGPDREDSHASARDYEAAGNFTRSDDDWGHSRDQGRSRYGQRDAGNDGAAYGASTYGQRDYGRSRDAARNPQGGYGRHAGPRDSGPRQGYDDYRGGYGANRAPAPGRHPGDDHPRGPRFAGGRDAAGSYGNSPYGSGQYGAAGRQHPQPDRNAPQGYEDDRGFFARAGDEVRSWFGDEEAERRREADMRYDERAYNDRDADYGDWRRGQIAALDRDYEEYRHENRSRFENEFATWRSGRQTQRDSLGKVTEHMDVVGSDGSHVGTVDKVRGDRILLTKSDPEADGRHHSIPSRWIDTVDTKVTLSKSAEEAKQHWRDEERNQAMFGDGEGKNFDRGDSQGRMLNRSFSGTY